MGAMRSCEPTQHHSTAAFADVEGQILPEAVGIVAVRVAGGHRHPGATDIDAATRRFHLTRQQPNRTGRHLAAVPTGDDGTSAIPHHNPG